MTERAGGPGDRDGAVGAVAGPIAEIGVRLGPDVARQHVGPGPARQAPAVRGGRAHPDRAVDRSRSAEDAAARDVRGASGPQLDRMRPVGRVARHAGGEGGDVEDLRHPADRPGLQEEHPARAGRGEPPGQRAAGRAATDDHDVVLLSHRSRMAAPTDTFLRVRSVCPLTGTARMTAVAPLADLSSFLTASPTPYHAVAEAVRRLAAVGFTEQVETAPWSRDPGGRWLVRDGTLLAWWQRAEPAPLRIFAAHTDSPTLKVKPHPGRGCGRVAAGGGRGLRRRAVELVARPRPRAGGAARALRRVVGAGRRRTARSCASRSWPSTWTARSTRA